jgi:hypothetical protein
MRSPIIMGGIFAWGGYCCNKKLGEYVAWMTVSHAVSLRNIGILNSL